MNSGGQPASSSSRPSASAWYVSRAASSRYSARLWASSSSRPSASAWYVSRAASARYSARLWASSTLSASTEQPWWERITQLVPSTVASAATSASSTVPGNRQGGVTT